ncbi:MAG: leucine-rich repeat protein [Prevotella sp.]|nr:leucine-rich repeat protein [Prevotella sp.]
MMSKKAFFKSTMAFLLLFAVSTHVGAQEISVDAARQAAASFLKSHAAKLPAKSRKGMMKAPPAASQLQLVHTQEDQLHKSPALYVFEQPKSGGYVIASADERAYPILGYNENGTFREDSLPCCLKFILEEYGRQIAEARKQNLPRHTEKAENESWQNIEPLITCAWDQYAPFNNLCPIDKNTGKRCVTGCVATAMAQIMYYWKWPERGVGSYSYQTYNVEGTLTANFGETTYRWDLMKDDYNYQNGYDDPEDAVATLLYHCGVACRMFYSSSQSGATEFATPLKEFFNYSRVSTYINDENVLFQQSSVYKELLHGRPVGVNGGNGYSAHAYLCDGYRNDGFFHFNFGWGRSSNYGFYKWGAINGYSTSVDEFRIAPNYYGDLTDKNGYVYNILDGEAYLVEVGNVEGDIEIPAEITKNETKYPVVEIHDEVFRNASITSVIIPNSVTRIGWGAFEGCSGLTSVTIPNSVTSIGIYAFSGCSGLTSVTIPNSVTNIVGHAFYGCSGLTSVTIPNSVTNIGRAAFSGCSGLTSVTIPNSVTNIVGHAFSGCTRLTNISVASGNIKYDSRNDCNAIIETASNTLIQGCKNTIIPNSVENIGEAAFSDCSGLTSVTIPNSVTSIGFYAFTYCSGLTNVTIPNSVTSIGQSAFRGCSGLTSVTIPNSVTSIGEYAFYICTGLRSVISCIENPFAIAHNTFELYGHYNKEKNEYEYPFTDATLYVPIGTAEKYKSTDGWKNFKNIVEIEIDGIEGIYSDENNREMKTDNRWYSVDGVKLNGEPTQKGVYIVNGKKVVK